MARALLLGIGACAPHMDPGPIAAARAAEPVVIRAEPTVEVERLGIAARVRAGSAADPAGFEGVAWLAAHAGAGSAAVQVRREWVELRLECPEPVDAAACAAELAEALTGRPDDADLVGGRARAEARVAELLADPVALRISALEALLYEAHPYGHPVSGRSGTRPVLDADDVASFRARHWVRANVAVTLAGEWPAAVVDDLRARLEALPAAIPPERALIGPMRGGRLLLVEADLAPGIALGATWKVRDERDRLAMLTALAVVDPASELDCGEGPVSWGHPYWSIPAVPPEPEALQAALAGLRRLAAGEVTEAEHAATAARLVATCGPAFVVPSLASVNAAARANLSSSQLSAVAIGVDPRTFALAPEDALLFAEGVSTIEAEALFR